MKLLIDMNLSPRRVEHLARAGHDAIHWSTVGEHSARDIVIMQYAREHDFIVLTHDLDFGAILAATAGKRPSVVQIRTDNLSPDIIGPTIVTALIQLETELAAGALLTVDPGRTRVTLLPLPVSRS